MKKLCCVMFVICFCVLTATKSYADYYKVYSPRVDEGEASAEADVNYSGDHRKSLDNYLSQVYGIEYGVTSFWSTELSGEIEKSSGMDTQLTMVKWENILVPFRPGEYWLDAGLYLELEKAVRNDMPNNVELRGLLEKRFDNFINTANISFSQNFGPNSVKGLDHGVSWRTKYHMNDMFEPGIEYYSDLGRLNRDDDRNRQDSVVGPVVQGRFGEVNFDTGVLFGVTPSAHDVTFKLNLEFGF